MTADMNDDLSTDELLAEAERIAANQYKDGRYAAARILRILCKRLTALRGVSSDWRRPSPYLHSCCHEAVHEMCDDIDTIIERTND